MPVPYSTRITWSGHEQDNNFGNGLYRLLKTNGKVLEEHVNGTAGATRKNTVFSYQGSTVKIIEDVAGGMRYFEIKISNPERLPKDLTDKIRELDPEPEAEIRAS